MMTRVVLALLLLGSISPAMEAENKTVVFAGGCFWCMQPQFDQTEGVVKTAVGYSGGASANPTYEQVTSGKTGHKEVIQITYDPDKISFEKLLKVFWYNIDPLDDRGQFCDKGTQYAAAIFVADDAERTAAMASIKEVETKLGQKIATQILDATPFYMAEDYHQDYYKKNPLRYKMYKAGCGRDERTEEIWDSSK